jgi:hypothetical protein
MNTFIDSATILLLGRGSTTSLCLKKVGIFGDRAGGVFLVRGGFFVGSAFLIAEHDVFLNGLANR